jgi:hypothetical protein
MDFHPPPPPAAPDPHFQPDNGIGGLLGDIPEFKEKVRADHGALLPPPPHNGIEHRAPVPSPAPSRPIDPLPPTPEASPAEPRPPQAAPAPAVGPSVARRGLAMVANVLVASALLAVVLWVGTIYLHEGKFDLSSLSWESFRALFRGPGELRAVDVSNGLYETSGGKHVFYVRGEVENRGSSAKRARVSVEILDGSQPLTRAEVLAGASPNAEELYGLSSAADLSALDARLAKAAAEVSPGKRVPFLVAFYEYPPDLSQYRLRVTVRDARESTR